MSEVKTGGHHRVINFKKVTIPDVGERTGNDPCYLMSSGDVLKLINRPRADRTAEVASTGMGIALSPLEKKDISKETISEVVARSLELGWSDVQLHGKQLLFIK